MSGRSSFGTTSSASGSLGVYGFTPPIKGLVGDWSGVILAGIFGTGGVMAVGQMFFNRRERS
jgi:hypothetical protein